MGSFRPSYALCFFICCVGQVFVWSSALSQGEPTDSSLAAGFMEKGYELCTMGRYDSSMVYYQRASSILEQTRHRTLYLHSLNKIGDNYNRRTQCDAALMVLRKALQVEENEFGGKGLESAETYTLIGYALSYKNRADLAIEYINKGLAIRKKELGENHPLVAESYYMLGIALTKKGDLDKALESLEEGLTIQKEENSGNYAEIASTLIAIGSVYHSKSEYSSCIRCFSEALSLLPKSVERSAHSEATCYFYIATSQQECGDIVGAIGNYTKALSLSRDLFGEEHQTISALYAELANLYEIYGDYDRAIEFCEKALRLMIKLNGEKHSGVAAIYSMLGGIYGSRNELHKALSYTLKGLSIQRNTLGKNHPGIGLTYERVANIYRKQRAYSKALEYYRGALQRRLQLGGSEYRVDIGRIYLRIGSLYGDIQKYSEAATSLSKALHILENTTDKNQPLLASTYKAFGDLYAQKHDYSRALSNYDMSISLQGPRPGDSSVQPEPIPYTFLNGKGLLEALTAKARTYENRYQRVSHDLGDLQAALSDYERAVELVEQLRGTYKAEGSKLFLQGEHLPVYEAGTRVSVSLLEITGQERYKESAFSFAEKSKANVLLDGIREAESRHFAGIPDSLLAKEQRLRTDITLYETQLLRLEETDGRKGGTKIHDLQNKLFTLDQEYQHLLELFETSYPKYYELKHKSHFATAVATQQLLDEETCLFEYFIGERSLYLFAIARNSFDLVALPKPIDFGQSTTAFCQSIKTIDQEEYLHTSSVLYKLLIEPVEEHLANKRKLVIIPDGVLYQVPFEALISTRPRNRKGSEGPVDFSRLSYLVDKYEISYAYSSSYYVSHEQKPAKGRHESAGFAGFAPVFRDSTTNGYILASNVSFHPDEISELRSFTVDGKRFRELPYSEEEVRSISSDFARRGNPSIGYFYSDATKENFKRDAGKYTYLHVATHGYMNENHPGLSALLFAQTPDPTSSDDIILYAGETYNLTLNADLLVLSSCESGTGKIVKGEGMMGMTRGFFYAGARNIMYSLWKVFDKHTNRLMQDFYEHVLNGETYSSSLREAKLNMIKNPATAFPSKWAGFVLMGE